jgi:TatD DNase family protein
LIDTHAHIYDEKFKDDINEVIERAIEAGIEKIYLPNIDSTTIDDMLELELKYPDYCIPMMGLHPCSVNKNFEKELYIVEDWFSKREFVAVGEIGTDLYWEKSFFEQQKEAFNIQSEIALKNNIPIVIHCRDSIPETIELVSNIKNDNFRGIFHCFSGNLEQANEIIELGFYLGLGGVATFKNGGLEEVITNANFDKIVLETDSPYLAPVPYRGKRNEPYYVVEVAKKIAAIKNISIDEVGETTSRNALKIFKP